MTVSFNARRNRWVYDFQFGGVRHQGYCLDAAGKPVTSRSAARQAEGVARRLASLAPKIPAAGETTLAQVVADLQPGWMRGKQWRNRRLYAREIVTFFGASYPVASFDDDAIRRYKEHVITQPIRVWTGAQRRSRDDGAQRYWKDTGKTRSAATINRRLQVLRQIIARAAQIRDPVTGAKALPNPPAVDDMPEPKRRARPIPEPVLARLQEILPQHVVDALVLTLCFGFRRGEAFGLQDHQVDWYAQGVRLHAESVKDAEDVFLPGSQFAMGYLRCLAMEAEARGVHHLISYCHTRNSDAKSWRPIKSAKTAWRNAMATIEAEFGRRWRWHDLRAAFITHIALTSGALAAQRMARHSDFATTRAYVDVADDVLRRAAERADDRPALRIVGRGKTP